MDDAGLMEVMTISNHSLPTLPNDVSIADLAFLVPTSEENLAVLEILDETNGLFALSFDISPIDLASVDVIPQDPHVMKAQSFTNVQVIGGTKVIVNGQKSGLRVYDFDPVDSTLVFHRELSIETVDTAIGLAGNLLICASLEEVVLYDLSKPAFESRISSLA
jgi:hypothetical protein